jgi:UDP-GlcNAc:undecaprenyl-phosphate/decaprenyl-phosphate GlcNAc-1-phosphate transferase
MPFQLPPLSAFIISLGSAAAAMPLLKRLALALGITASRAAGATPSTVPTLGGPGIIASFALGAGVLGMLPLWLAIGPLFLCLAGVIDDAIVLTPGQKIAAELIATLTMIVVGPAFAITGIAPLDKAVVGLWLLGTTNAFNLIDGLDGLAGGIGLIVASAISVAGLMHNQIMLAVDAAALAGALAGFLMFNFSPASIFMGDSGALPTGMLLGALALRSAHSATPAHLMRLVFPIVVMMVPLLDTGVVIVSRIATGRPISRRSLDHAHDRLLMLGLSSRSTALACWVVELFFALCALMMSLMTSIYIVMLLPAVAMMAAVAGLFMADLTFDVVSPSSAYEELRGLGRLLLRLTYQWRIADMLLDTATISTAYFGAYLLRLDFRISASQFTSILANWWRVLLVSYSALLVTGVYRNMWRYVSMSEALRFVRAALLAGLLVAGLQLLRGQIPRSIPLLFAILLVNLLIVTRFSFHLLRRAVQRLASSASRALIVGAGPTGVALIHHLRARPRGGFKQVVGFLDDDPFKRGKLIEGYRVLGSLDSIKTLYQRAKFDEVIIAASSLPQERLDKLRLFVQQNGVALTNFELTSNIGEDFGHEPVAVPNRLSRLPMSARS